MTNREMILSDAYMIEMLHDGGMAIASKNLLFQVIEDYRNKSEPIFKVGLRYLIEYLMPYVKGRKKHALANEIAIVLFPKVIDVSWSEWVSYFPGTSVEPMEDRENGRRAVVNVDRICEMSQEDLLKRKAGLFYTPNGFHEYARVGHALRRDAGNIKSINAFYVDLDGASTPENKSMLLLKISESKVMPSFVVETKNGFHVIWLLERFYSENDVSDWKRIQTGLIGHFGSDRACSDVSRLLRMPNSWHCKDLWKEELEEKHAFLVKLVFRSGRMYRFEDFKVFGFKLDEKKTIFLSDYKPSGLVVAPIDKMLEIGSRHGTLTEEAARVYARLGTDTSKGYEARSILKDWYKRSCQTLKGQWEKEVDGVCDWIEEKQFNKK